MALIARYDLKKRLTTFDFFTWLVHVQTLDATEVVFDERTIKSTKWDIEESQRRIKNILKPGCAFAGMPFRSMHGFGPCTGDDIGSHMLQGLVGKPFRRLRTVKPRGSARYTVTLRETRHVPHRNSNIDRWRAFAKRIGAVVIEDYRIKPMHIHDRMALYAGAEMNFGVTNGPMGMLYLTDYPYMVFDCLTNAKGFASHGIEIGGQVPWANKNQRLVWDKQDTLDQYP